MVFPAILDAVDRPHSAHIPVLRRVRAIAHLLSNILVPRLDQSHGPLVYDGQLDSVSRPRCGRQTAATTLRGDLPLAIRQECRALGAEDRSDRGRRRSLQLRAIGSGTVGP